MTSVMAWARLARGEREESERWRPFTHDEITARDPKANLGITRLRRVP